MNTFATSAITPGLMVIHSNHPEALRDVVVAWMQRYPLKPLESETILVQSNGIAQWLKLSLAQPVAEGGCGITAAVDVQLPAQFLWQAYRSVLGKNDVPEISPLDKQPLTWRLMRLLPDLLAQPAFVALHRFLEHDSGQRKLYQLSERIADLFDQYQVYRADWLTDWVAGKDVLRTARGVVKPLDEEQRWQAVLWRAVLADVGEEGMATSRAAVHQRFLDYWARQAESGEAVKTVGLPRRLIVFGISSMPAQTLQALAAIAAHSQVLLCVHNPCRHHWTDIVADKDLLRHQYRRQQRKSGMAEILTDDELHQHAHPLLAAWGKQGRDYIHLIDEFDNPAQYASLLTPVNGGRIDLFSEDDPQHMLGQLQDDILDLRPLAESAALWPQWVPADDDSIRFHTAHSPQREVEVLHDQLLARLDANPHLRARDIIVMVPDINVYSPHIEAVFGRLPRSDPRYIPFTLADQGQRGREPMLVALEHVLALPESRFAVSEILDLLAVDALRQRFGIQEAEVPLLHRWMEGSGVRWGLDAEQRAHIGLAQAGEVNSWRFGLRRMLLGFAVGQGSDWQSIEPYDEIGGLDAVALGGLAALLRALDATCDLLDGSASPQDWTDKSRAVLDLLFAPQQEREKMLHSQLMQGLDRWLLQCEAAQFDEPVPLTVLREVWMAGMDSSSLNQRFMAGAVSFCSLMPMRAIPFKLVCLLGMNDGAYPRPVSILDFDLMRQEYRPGDRSRRDDDRYLLLEALLSAREQLYISWVGRSIRDSTARPPSVLVGQLRDHLAQGWRLAGGDRATDTGKERAALLDAMTQEHPLQPFSPRYFAQSQAAAHGAAGLYTYAQEWQGVHRDVGAQEDVAEDTALLPHTQDAAMTVRALQDFITQPVKAFMRQRLKVFFTEQDLTSLDEELFAPDGLQKWQLQAQLLAEVQPWLLRQVGAMNADALVEPLTVQLALAVNRLQREGRLPLQAFAECAAGPAVVSAGRALKAYADALQFWPHALDESIELRSEEPQGGASVADWLRGLLSTGTALHAFASEPPYHFARITLSASRLHSGKSVRWERMLPAWVEHLAWHIAGRPLVTVVCSESGMAVFAPLDAGLAASYWADLLHWWSLGMQQPLPLAARTGLAMVLEELPPQMIATVYDDPYLGTGDVQRVAELARTFPDFDSLLAARVDGYDTLALAGALYSPMLDNTRLVNDLYPQVLERYARGEVDHADAAQSADKRSAYER